MAGIVYCGTGHRPPKLGLDYSKKSDDFLRNFLIEELLLLEIDNEDILIGGCATGYDQAFMEAGLELSIPVIAAMPFPSMAARWPQSGKDRLDKILKRCSNVVYVSDDPYTNKKFAIRDKYMVDNSHQVVALFDSVEPNSGTGITVNYAARQGKHIINLWERYEKSRSGL